MSHESTRKYLFMWIEAEVFLPFEQKGGSSADSEHPISRQWQTRTFPAWECERWRLSSQGRTQGSVTVLNTVCDLEKAGEASPDTSVFCALRNAGCEDFQPLHKCSMGCKEYFFLQKDKKYNGWTGLGLHCIHKGKKKWKHIGMS